MDKNNTGRRNGNRCHPRPVKEWYIAFLGGMQIPPQLVHVHVHVLVHGFFFVYGDVHRPFRAGHGHETSATDGGMLRADTRVCPYGGNKNRRDPLSTRTLEPLAPRTLLLFPSFSLAEVCAFLMKW